MLICDMIIVKDDIGRLKEMGVDRTTALVEQLHNKQKPRRTSSIAIRGGKTYLGRSLRSGVDGRRGRGGQPVLGG